MTDSFQTDKTVQNNEQGNTVDNFTTKTDESNVDTKSVEYQLQILQKRVNDQSDFIDQLKSENKEAREKARDLEAKYKSLADEASTAADIWERMQDTQHNSNTGTQTELDVDKLREKGFLTKEDLQTEELERQRKANLSSTVQAAVKAFGDDWQKAVESKLIKLNMTGEELDALSGHNPKAALALLGIDDKPVKSSLNTSGTVNTQSLNNKGQQSTRQKSLMVGASSKDLIDSIKEIRRRIEEQNKE